MSQAEDQMPERYRPDPYADATVYERHHGRLRATMPRPIFDWMDAEVGDVLSAAPKSNVEIDIGHEVPNILNEFVIHRKYDGTIPFRKVPDWVFGYLDAEEGDTLRFHKVDGGDRVRIEKLEVDDD